MRERERESNNTLKCKQDLLDELQSRVDNKIIEENNYILLKKLIEKAETLEEAIAIQQLGTMWKKTGFSYNVRLEKMTDDIYYFKKDEKLSFTQPEAKQTHKLIIGDNYKALINLQQEYQGKIKMIYIDPPYGKDSMGQFAQTNYKNNITRDNLLSMLEPRLRLARNLLSDDGVIFCSIDDKNQAYVKILFDDVFGEGHFVKCLVRKTKSYDRTKGDANFQDLYDYILLYCKNKNNVCFKKIISGEQEYPYEDEKGQYRLTSLQQPGGQHATRDERPNLYYSIYYNEETKDFSLIEKDNYIEILPKKIGTKDGSWMWSKPKFEADNKDCIVKGDKIFIKRYFDDNEDQNKYKHQEPLLLNYHNSQGTSMLSDINIKDVFDFSKPVELLKHLINTIEDKNSIILDFFAGSGTTGQAVLEQNKADGGNRQFILVQLDEEVEGIQKEFCEKNNLPLNLASITYERLKRVMTGTASDGSNFKWLEKNEKLGDNLLVCEVSHCANFDKNVFENIDETLYGIPKFEKPIDKINWVCDNFEGTQKVLENKDGKQENKQGFIEE